MPHDSTKVKLGVPMSSARVVTCEPAASASFPAGLAVRRKSDGGLQTADDSTAGLIGVSLGRALTSAADKTSVCRKGLGIPLLLKDYYASVKIGDITFTALAKGTAGNDITITLADELSDASASIETDPEAPNDIIIHIESGATVAEDIVAAIEADEATAALISAVADEGDEAATQLLAAETPLTGGIDVAEYGQGVFVNDEGLGCDSGDGDAAATGATYVSATLTGVKEDDTEASAALIDIKGAL